ncbi:MAG: hypothetical protein J6334_03125, partial [Kiritimatiellae bacterium]|nr:hypothetical protein [Kiritimatiellia bacterium]
PAVTAAQRQVTQAAAAVADPAAIAAFAGARTTAADTAVPEVKWGTVYVKKPATPEQVLEAKNAFLADKRDLANATVRFEGVDDATVAATLAVFHQAATVDVEKSTLSTLAPFALLRNAKKIGLNKVGCTDLKPLAGLPNLVTLSLHYCKLDNFAPLATLQALEELDLYGAEVTGSLAPLAACPKLNKVDFYAVKGPQAFYDSLGSLKQVKEFHGGLTKMTSIQWLRAVPQAETVQIFAEKIDDLTPISTLVNLTYFRGWNMDGGSMATALGDLSFLAPCRKLKRLDLPGSAFTNTALIGTFTELEELDLSRVKQPVDVSFVKSLPKLKRISLYGTEVINGNAIPPSVKIYSDKKTTGL